MIGRKKIYQLSKLSFYGQWTITHKISRDVINFSMSEPFFPMPANIRNAAQEIVLSEDLSYTEPAGLLPLRKLIAQENNLPEEGYEVSITGGASEALFSGVVALSEPGDEILIPAIGNPSYEVVVNLAECVPIRYPIQIDKPDPVLPEQISKFMTPKTSMIILNSPMDPTGQVIDKHVLHTIADVCHDKGILCMVDESYREITYESKTFSLSGYNPYVITFTSVSKLFDMSGWRIGWIIGSEEVIDLVNFLRNYSTTCAPTISQRVAMRILEGTGREQRDKILSILANRKKLMRDLLMQHEFYASTAPRGGYFLFFNYQEYCEKKIKSIDFSKLLLEKYKVAVVPGIYFGETGEGYIRIAFATDEKSIQEGFARIRQCLTDLNKKN
ncbi:MAG: pyridoxal phosphate-dependent aminotransferase [Candidatus Marinimicrobia bacterium]|nr:pyridoxal phosphate-dependent aminotransferase [Candidatus Neomarinimicrobiota bacterium]MDD5581826.1 pyridoxal phosphate-dependent aminotransferase [Candidatus Neomarinimicrobiota bacterium]